MNAEAATAASLQASENGGMNTNAGVWVVSFAPELPAGSAEQSAVPSYGSLSLGRHDRFNLPGSALRPNQPVAPPVTAVSAVGNVISTIVLHCCGVNRQTPPSANFDLAYAVFQNLTNSAYFTDQSKLGEDFKTDEGSNTFSFSLTAQLRHPFKRLD
jgi:hypothetical protein